MSSPTPYPDPRLVEASRPGVAVDSKAVSVSGGNVVWTGPYPDALRVDVAGTVCFQGLGGTTDTWTCVAGDIIPVVMTTVFQSGTTASGLHALYTYGGPRG